MCITMQYVIKNRCAIKDAPVGNVKMKLRIMLKSLQRILWQPKGRWLPSFGTSIR